MTPLAYALWLELKAPPRAEIIAGLRKGVLLPASLGGAEATVKPGQPLRASGYGENRASYTQALFAPSGEEPRTLHLGLDVFAPAGAEVRAPLAARVHSFRDNANPGDYGPCLILEHDTGDGVFHTLYGHLSRASLDGLTAGHTFNPGDRIARLGDPQENGGWPPHLHFQILLEVGANRGDYPGVCKRSEQDRWLAICPDPAPFLGVALQT